MISVSADDGRLRACDTRRPAFARRRPWIDGRNMWASLAIIAIWLSVLLTAVLGPDLTSVDAGGSSTTIPSAIGVALFALFATRAVAKHGFERTGKDD